MFKALVRSIASLVVLVASGCFPPPEAPSELNELVHYIYREWENEDPRVLEAGIENLEAFLTELDPGSGLGERSFSVTPLAREDLATIERTEERDPADTFGIAVALSSKHTVDKHALLQTDDDQLPAEPSAAQYKRHFKTDRDCFRKQTCDVLRTENDITRQNALMYVDMKLFKHFRWVQMEGDRKAMVARSWTPQPYRSRDNENTAILQSYSLDIVVPTSSGETWRIQIVYSETSGLGGNDLQAYVVTESTEDGLEAADEVIGERHGK